YHLQRGEIPHCSTMICLIPGLFFDTLPAQLISGMNRQLLEEDPLCQTTSHPEGMQHVDFTIVMRQPLDELLLLQANHITFFLQILHQGIALFFDISKVAERRIALININFTQLPCPVENILVQLAMDSAQMR